MGDDLLAVIVRYNTPPDQSQACRGLLDAFAENAELADRVKVLLCDNSAAPLGADEIPVGWQYQHLRQNLGVSGAFNRGLRLAEARGDRWMLLLDQDSDITPQFLTGMLKHTDLVRDREEIAAVVPVVIARGVVVSPRRHALTGETPYRGGECGVAEGEAVAINSGAVLRVSALAAIGGFSYEFWLDYSDMHVFHELYRRGWKVWRAADVLLEHDMTVMDYERNMRPSRLQNMTEAESAFYDMYRTPLENAVHDLRLLGRAVKQRFKYTNSEFSRIARSHLAYRLLTSRRERLRSWHAGAAARVAAGAVNEAEAA